MRRVINQDGILEAPLGTINLGWNGAAVAPTDPITGTGFPATQTLTLGPGSVTSVSGSSAGFVSGPGLPIPYGIYLQRHLVDRDPTGTDISNGGPPAKNINLGGGGVVVAAGATVDAAGGGDLYAYQFIPGVGGTSDILTSSSGSFAVIPGYQAGYALNAAFNSNQTGEISQAQNLLYPDGGYSSTALSVGEQVHIDVGNGAGRP